jgi:Flp pilus assembly pilin Flp
MSQLVAAARKFAAGEEGASLVEYSLLVALLAAASIAVLYGLGREVRFIFGASNESLITINNVITSAS